MLIIMLLMNCDIIELIMELLLLEKIILKYSCKPNIENYFTYNLNSVKYASR